MSWSEHIEPQIRPWVMMLRNNGINTTCSCGHDMYIEFDILDGSQITQVDYLLYNAGARNYEIECHIIRENGHLTQRGRAIFKGSGDASAGGGGNRGVDLEVSHE